MSKSVLMVDTQESCWKCSLRNANECIVAEKTITRREYGKRQEWCPLRKLPEKVQVSGTYGKGDTPASYKIGWNACIDALKGENEK